MKISKKSSPKYYRRNKERVQKNAPEKYQNFSKEEKKKINNMVVNVTKIFQKMKSKTLLSIEMKKNVLL